jgi:hypothetical protein
MALEISGCVHDEKRANSIPIGFCQLQFLQA